MHLLAFLWTKALEKIVYFSTGSLIGMVNVGAYCHLSWSPGCNPVMGDKRAKQLCVYLLFCKDKIGETYPAIEDLLSAVLYWFLTILQVLKSAQLPCLNFLDRSWSSHYFQYGGTLYYVGTPTYSGTGIYLVFSFQSHPLGSPNLIPSE